MLKQDERYSKKFNEMIANLVEEEGYRYKVCIFMFGEEPEEPSEKKKNNLLKFAASYYWDEEDYEFVSGDCCYSDGEVYAQLIVRWRPTEDEAI